MTLDRRIEKLEAQVKPLEGCLYDHLGNQVEARILKAPTNVRGGIAELDGTRKSIASTCTIGDVVLRAAERARDRKQPEDEDTPAVEPNPMDYSALLFARPDGQEAFVESMCRIQRERTP